MQIVSLKAGKEKLASSRHPWIFSGAVQAFNNIPAGSIVKVQSARGDLIGFAFANAKSDIPLRMLHFGEGFAAENFIEQRLTSAAAERKLLVPAELSTGYRLINAEADGLPGLVIDCFADTAVLQVSTAGIETRLSEITSVLREKLGFAHVYQKSNSPARVREGLSRSEQGWIGIAPTTPVEIIEHGIRYRVPIEAGQKTGFFLDQREMRLMLRHLACGQRVLNTFCYTGGFSLNAAKGGAVSITSVDSSQPACDLLREQAALNKLDVGKIVCADVIEFLNNSTEQYDLIILDPPPYVKKARDLQAGFKQYLELNSRALRRLAPGGTLLSFSCSPFMPEESFQKMLYVTAQNSARHLRIVGKHRYAPDHSVSIFHPEGSYLKGFVLKEAQY